MSTIKKYNKLVRDNIPSIIRSKGLKCKIKVVSGTAKTHYLVNKLKEEVNEFSEDHSIEELADVCTVIYALMENLNIKEDDLIEAVQKKGEINGLFNDGLVLREVITPKK